MITIQEENFYDVFIDSIELRKQNFLDGPLPLPGLELDLDVAKYKLMAQKGIFVVVTAREGKKLVGYYSAIVDTHLHFATLVFGFGDAYVIDKAYRGQGLGAKLFAHMEKCWKDKGAVAALVGSRKENPTFVSQGWVHAEHRYVKALGGSNG